MKLKTGRTRHLLTTAILMTALTACSGTGLPTSGEFKRIGNQSFSERSPNSRRTANDAVNFFAEAPVTRLETGGSNSFSLTSELGQEVPNVTVGAINAARWNLAPCSIRWPNRPGCHGGLQVRKRTPC